MRGRKLPFVALACLTVVIPAGGAPPQPSSPLAARPARLAAGGKKLIEFGKDEPDTAFLRQHIARMEETPFDGTVFTIKYTSPDGSQGDFQWENWGKRAFTEAQFRPALEDLKATPFRRFTHNFLRVNAASRDHDWFDDFAAIVQNARLAASIARQADRATGAVPGLLFDPEQYNDKLFTYSARRDRATKSWDQYAAQARKRGREVMEAFQEGYPDLTVFCTLGYSGAWYAAQGGKPLKECDYGLLAPFMDGMTEAVRGRTRIVDGYELGYYLNKETLHFGYKAMDRDLLGIVADPGKYRRVTSLGFGLWMDKNFASWNTEDVSKNHWTPAEWEATVRKALELSDEYVWVYTDTPRWWTQPEGKPSKVPAAYDTAIRRARKGLATD